MAQLEAGTHENLFLRLACDMDIHAKGGQSTPCPPFFTTA